MFEALIEVLGWTAAKEASSEPKIKKLYTIENSLGLPDDSVASAYKYKETTDEMYLDSIKSLISSKSYWPIACSIPHRIDICGAELIKSAKEEVLIFMPNDEWRSDYPKIDEAISQFLGKFHRITKLKIPNDLTFKRVKFFIIVDGKSSFFLARSKEDETKDVSLTKVNDTEFITKLKKAQKQTDLEEMIGIDPYKDEKFSVS